MRCPDCHRETYHVSQKTRTEHYLTGKPLPKPPKAGVILAARADGTCTTCCRRQRGKTRTRTYDAGARPERLLNKTALTDEEVEAIREKLTIMALDRRARGIPEDGITPYEWKKRNGNGGLYSFQVP